MGGHLLSDGFEPDLSQAGLGPHSPWADPLQGRGQELAYARGPPTTLRRAHAASSSTPSVTRQVLSTLASAGITEGSVAVTMV
jgi:hypothetical protein